MDKPTNKRSLIDLTITGGKCRIHRNDHVARSLEEGANLMELQASTKYNCGSNSDESLSSISRSPSLRVDRYDARTLLDGMSLQQLVFNKHHNINIDVGIVSSEHASQPLDEEGSIEEVAARNFERYGMLTEYSSCFLKSNAKDGEEKLASRKSSLGNDDCAIAATQTKTNLPDDKEKPFELSEKQLQGMPSDITLVSEIYICIDYDGDGRFKNIYSFTRKYGAGRPENSSCPLQQ